MSPCLKNYCNKFDCVLVMKLDCLNRNKIEIFYVTFGNFQDSCPVVNLQDSKDSEK